MFLSRLLFVYNISIFTPICQYTFQLFLYFLLLHHFTFYIQSSRLLNTIRIFYVKDFTFLLFQRSQNAQPSPQVAISDKGIFTSNALISFGQTPIIYSEYFMGGLLCLNIWPYKKRQRNGNCPNGGFRSFVLTIELTVWYILAGFGSYQRVRKSRLTAGQNEERN